MSAVYFTYVQDAFAADAPEIPGLSIRDKVGETIPAAPGGFSLYRVEDDGAMPGLSGKIVEPVIKCTYSNPGDDHLVQSFYVSERNVVHP